MARFLSPADVEPSVFRDPKYFPIRDQSRFARPNPCENFFDHGDDAADEVPAAASATADRSASFYDGNVSANGPAVTALRDDQLPVALQRAMLPGEQGVLVTELDRSGRAVKAWVEPVVMMRAGPIGRAEIARVRLLMRRGCIEGRMLFYASIAVSLLFVTVLAFGLNAKDPTTRMGPFVLVTGYLVTATAAVPLRKVVAFARA